MSENHKAALRLKEKMDIQRLRVEFFETLNFEELEFRVAAYIDKVDHAKASDESA